jgi:hypothetical protein
MNKVKCCECKFSNPLNNKKMGEGWVLCELEQPVFKLARYYSESFPRSCLKFVEKHPQEVQKKAINAFLTDGM